MIEAAFLNLMCNQPSKEIMLQAGSQKAKDAVLIVRFTEWYCKARHCNQPRSPLQSEGAEAGIYRGSGSGTRGSDRIPMLCDRCADYARYAEQRTALCPNNPKPFCSVCEIKCYKSEMAEYSRQIMRYSGPRSIFSRYVPAAIRHALASRRYNKARVK